MGTNCQRLHGTAATKPSTAHQHLNPHYPATRAQTACRCRRHPGGRGHMESRSPATERKGMVRSRPRTHSDFGSRYPGSRRFLAGSQHNEVVSHLNEEGKQSLLVEGGAHTLQSFIAAELWDVTRMRMTSSGGAVASPAQPPCFHSSIF